jgi:hypothetical protein
MILQERQDKRVQFLTDPLWMGRSILGGVDALHPKV